MVTDVVSTLKWGRISSLCLSLFCLKGFKSLEPSLLFCIPSTFFSPDPRNEQQSLKMKLQPLELVVDHPQPGKIGETTDSWKFGSDFRVSQLSVYL